MKRRCLFTMLFALTGLEFAFTPGLSPDTAHSAAPDDDAEKITKELTQLSNQWAQAFIHKDMSFLKRIWADDFSYIMPDGTVYTKKAFLDLFEIETDTSTYTSVAITTFKVRVYGNNFTVAAGADHFKGKDKDGKPISHKGRFTNVWVRKSGTWQVVAGHASRLK